MCDLKKKESKKIILDEIINFKDKNKIKIKSKYYQKINDFIIKIPQLHTTSELGV